MKWYAAQKKPEQASVLAIVETLAASCVAVWFAVHFQTLLPFAISVIVAPLLLLRTRDSTARGLRLARRAHAWEVTRSGLLGAPWLIAGLFLGPVVIRIVSVIGVSLKRPSECVNAIPPNWWRMVARVDSSVLPEPVPGERGTFRARIRGVYRNVWAPSFPLFAWRSVSEGMTEFATSAESNRFARLATRLIQGGTLLGIFSILLWIYLPAVAYRWALKSS